MNLTELTIHEAGERLRKREISSQELTEAVFQRISDTESKLHSYITLCRQTALEQAMKADERIKRGEYPNPLLGIPIAVKDNFLTEGIKTTCASNILGEFIPPYDSTAAKKLREAGAVILGKTNLDEFAMGSSAENSALFPTRNPWNTSRVPGGSSGGSAAAVAADQCIVAVASSMDQVGPMTKDVRDCALLLTTIAGYDPRDSTSVSQSVPTYTDGLRPDIKGLRIGIPKEYFISGLQPEVEQAVRDAARQLEGHGAILEEVSLPHTEYAVAVYYVVATAEASSNLARYDGMRYGHRAQTKDLTETYMLSREEGFGPEVKRRIMLGTYVLSAGYYDAYYLKAQKVRTLIKKDFEEAFQRVDAIITPTAPTTAFKIGEKSQDPLQMYLSDIYTISVNLAGVPALSLPCGFDSHGLPIGMQIIGKRFDESTILNIAYAYEHQSDWDKRKPRL